MESISATSAAGIQEQFLTLLTTQLRHQDPLEPTKQEDFLSQLAQFSTLEGIEKLNKNISSYMESNHTEQNDLAQFQQIANASNLVGKSVVYSTSDENGTKVIEGRAEAVVFQDQTIHLRLMAIWLSSVRSRKFLSSSQGIY